MRRPHAALILQSYSSTVTASVESTRSSGILLHLTSLPGPYGIGDLGSSAYRFADFLARGRQRIWQVLPLGPAGHGASPYSSLSTFAGNPMLVSPEPLLGDGLLSEEDLTDLKELPHDHVDFERLVPRKRNVLRTAFERAEERPELVDQDAYHHFHEHNADWLDDYALYMALKDYYDGKPWVDWDASLVQREPDALADARDEHAQQVRMHRFWQYLFHRQWTALKGYCNSRSISFFGDIPIYVAHDSADVWANQDLFFLDESGQPTVVSGVPPDYFSPEGQRWGNPIYRWDDMAENDYAWWRARLERILSRVDIVRLDHFRGFDAYWSIPASENTAINGEWVEGPGADFFTSMREQMGTLPLVAEDLGIITDSVRDLRDQFDLPGMAVLHFAFEDGPGNGFLPHNYIRNVVAYTGTHDNDTTVGWWHGNDLTDRGRDYARKYLDLPPSEDPVIHWNSLRFLMASVADRVIAPLQDIMGLGSVARMNTPGRSDGNWTWRFHAEQLGDDLADKLAVMAHTYGRAGEHDG